MTAPPAPEVSDKVSPTPPRRGERFGAGLAAPAIGDLAARDDVAEVPSEEAPGWRSVQAGLTLQCWSHLLGLLTVALGFVFLMLLILSLDLPTRSTAPLGRWTEPVLIVLFAGLTLSWLSSWVLALVASCFFVLTPGRGQPRALGIASLAWSGLLLLQGVSAAPFRLLSGYEYDSPFPGVWFRLVSVAVLEIVRLVLLACLLRSLVQGLRLRGADTVSRLLVILTPALLFGSLALGAVLIGAGDRFLVFVLGAGSLVTVLVLGFVLALRIRTALRRGLPAEDGVPDHPTVP